MKEGHKPIKAPFPWFGGKSRIIKQLNERFGEVNNRVDAFCGSAAWFLASPPVKTETMNDMSGDIINAYRAIRADPDAVAHYCDYPISELDLIARKIALKETLPERAARLAADPDWYDAKAAGYFLYAQSLQIGLNIYLPGPWVVENGVFVRIPDASGVSKKRPQITKANGVTKQKPHLGHEMGVSKQRPQITEENGLTKQTPHLGREGGVSKQKPQTAYPGGTASVRRNNLVAWFRAIAERLRNVRVVCGDWRRVLTPTVTTFHGVTAILLDPPYPIDLRNPSCYAHDEETIWYDAARWAIENGENPLLRIAVCGYWTPEVDALFPASWSRFRWAAQGGMAHTGNGRGLVNRRRECIWFSPHCTVTEQERYL